MRLSAILLTSYLVLALLSECYLASRNFYKILGVTRDASGSEIKQSFRILAKKLHPDKNKGHEGANTKFQDLREAFNVLSDPEKRRLYDEGGEELVKKMGHNAFDGGIDPFDSFADLFGFGRPPGEGHERATGADVVMQVWVTYEDLYTGCLIQLERVKPVYMAAEGVRKCKCRFETIARQVDIGYFEMMQHQVCKECPNKELLVKSRLLDLEIQPGSVDGDEQKFYGEGEPHIDGEPGDLTVKIRTLPHERFERRGHHLYTNCTISLEQALMGFSLIMRHLDGRRVVITSNNVVWPGAVVEKSGEGMPMLGDKSTRGNLYITYDIEFPRGKLRVEDRDSLRRSLASFDAKESAAFSPGDDQKVPIFEKPIKFYNGLR